MYPRAGAVSLISASGSSKFWSHSDDLLFRDPIPMPECPLIHVIMPANSRRGPLVMVSSDGGHRQACTAIPEYRPMPEWRLRE
jgi:hypothetical protein